MKYLVPARTASDHGYAVAFLAVSALALVALVVTAVMVRRATTDPDATNPSYAAGVQPTAASLVSIRNVSDSCRYRLTSVSVCDK